MDSIQATSDQLIYRLKNSPVPLNMMDIKALLRYLVDAVEELKNAEGRLEDPADADPIGEGALATTRAEIARKAKRPSTGAKVQPVDSNGGDG
jgi:hypothetical protein